MKKIFVLSTLVFAFGLLAGCGQQNIPTELVDVPFESTTGDVQEDILVEWADQTLWVELMWTIILEVDEEASVLNWSAKRVLYGYVGEVLFKDGSLTLEDGVPTQGSFVLDMTNFTLDGPDRAREAISADMFEVAMYPESTLVIRSAKPMADDSHTFTMTADLTIKDVTNEINFVAVFTPDRRNATADFSIDRTRRGLVYQSTSVFSNLGDKAINDIIEFTVDLVLE